MYNYPKKTRVDFGLFQSKFDLKECMEFQLNHVSKLQKYAIKISSTGLNWIFSEGIYGISAKDEHGKLIGGIRVHVKSKNQKLPFEDATKSEITDYNPHRSFSAEMCALWASKKDNLDLPFSLVNCAAMLCKDLGIKKIYTFPWQKTQCLVKKIGFKIDGKMGAEKGVPYPNNKYRSFIMSAEPTDLKLAKTKETDKFETKLKMGRFNFKKAKNSSIFPVGIPTTRSLMEK